MVALVVCDRCGASPEGFPRAYAEMGETPAHPCDECRACEWQVIDVDRDELEDPEDYLGDDDDCDCDDDDECDCED